MNLIAPFLNLEEGILTGGSRGEGADLKSVPSSLTDNFSSIIAGLLPSIPGIAAAPDMVAAVPDIKYHLVPVYQAEEGVTKAPERDTEGTVEENHSGKRYPIDAGKFIFPYTIGRADFSCPVGQTKDSPTQGEEIGPGNSVARLGASPIDLAEDMGMKAEKNWNISRFTGEGLEDLSPHPAIEQSISLPHQEKPVIDLPKSLLASLEIDLCTADFNEAISPVAGNPLPGQGISPGLTEYPEESLSGVIGRRFTQINTDSLTESLEEDLSTDLPKTLTHQTKGEQIKEGLSSAGYEKPVIDLSENPAFKKGIKPGATGTPEESPPDALPKTLTHQTEKILSSGRSDDGEIYYLKDLLPEYKLKTRKETPGEGLLSANTAKPLRETPEVLVNNLFTKDHPNSIANSSYNNILEEKVLDQVVKYARLNLKEGISEVEIHLKPELLGSLRIKVAVEGQEVKASFFADTPLVKEIIETHLPSLKQAFLAQNLDIQKFSVSVGYHPGREDVGNNNLKDLLKDKEGYKNKEIKKSPELHEVRKPEYHSLNLIDCFV